MSSVTLVIASSPAVNAANGLPAPLTSPSMHQLDTRPETTRMRSEMRMRNAIENKQTSIDAAFAASGPVEGQRRGFHSIVDGLFDSQTLEAIKRRIRTQTEAIARTRNPIFVRGGQRQLSKWKWVVQLIAPFGTRLHASREFPSDRPFSDLRHLKPSRTIWPAGRGQSSK